MPVNTRSDAQRSRVLLVDGVHTLLRAGRVGFSIPELAAVAGVGVATAYRHFPTPQDAMAALHERAITQLLEAFSLIDAEGSGPAARYGSLGRFHRFCGTWVEQSMQWGTAVRYIRSSSGFIERLAAGDEAITGLHDVLADVLEALVRDGKAPDLDILRGPAVDHHLRRTCRLRPRRTPPLERPRNRRPPDPRRRGCTRRRDVGITAGGSFNRYASVAHICPNESMGGTTLSSTAFHDSSSDQESAASPTVLVRSGRFAMVSTVVAVCMTLGFVFHLDSYAYLLLGIPFTLIFPLMLQRRSIRELWIRAGEPPPVDAKVLAIFVALLIYPPSSWPA